MARPSGPRRELDENMARIHRRYSKRRIRRRESDPAPRAAPKRNPPLMADLAEWVGPGFASFAATRFVTRVAATQIEQRKPSWGKHVGAGVSVGAFLAAWFLAHRLKWISRYHTPITVGAAIAALQSIIQLYIPRLGWMVADASPELAATSEAQVSATATSMPQLMPVDEDPADYTYNDMYDAGRLRTPRSAPSKVGPIGSPPGHGPAASPPSADDLSDLQIDDAIGASNLGVFSTSN